jgi:PEP-CTERM motif
VYGSCAKMKLKLEIPVEIGNSDQDESIAYKGAPMRKLSVLFLGLAALSLVPRAHAGVSSCVITGSTLSCTGTLGTPEDVFTKSFIASGSSVTIQTFGFGGGTNAASQSISAGGFDSLVALFSGTGPTASILLDGGGNPVASADNLSLFSPGCPPAGTVTIGPPPPVCGDNALVATVTFGLPYTLLLTDANFVPCAVNPGPPPAGGCTTNLSANPVDPSQYGDLSGGVFKTCNGFDAFGNPICAIDNGKFAVDISGVVTPEPDTLLLFGSGILGICWKGRRRASRGGVSTRKT